MATNQIQFKEIKGHFEDRFGKVKVFQITGGALNFAAFIYQCRLNMDIDGAPTTYGWDNPAEKNSLGEPNLQKNLHPLESWHPGAKGVSASRSQKVGLGNACGDPGDGSKGWQNFLNGSHNFYWAGAYAVTEQFAASHKLVIDNRPELEALHLFTPPFFAGQINFR
ncbi:MAG TPA: hypothetical protein VN776_10775 [Terracidiphilus sp.]|nr:hypothetical protein [Terracidiphilus sp.]